MDKNACIIPHPPEDMADFGPKFRVGCGGLILIYLLAIIALIVTLAITTSRVSGYRDQNPVLAYSIIGGVVLLFTLWELIAAQGAKTARDVLRGDLGFEVNETIGGVLVTTFIRPSAIKKGEMCSLLVAAQNTMSRSRILAFEYPRHTLFSDLSGSSFLIHLAPGQAMIFRQPLPSCHYLEKDVVVNMKIRIRNVAGMGRRILKKRRDEPFRIGDSRKYPLFLEIKSSPTMTADSSPYVTAQELPPAQCFSLHVPTMPEPRFEILRAITAAKPHESIDVIL